MKFKLKNGETVEIKPLDRTITAPQFKSYFNKIISEKPETFLYKDIWVSSKQQNKWLADQRENIRKREEVMLAATSGNKVVGMSEADRDHYRHRDKVMLSVSVTKAFRGLGLGKKLLAEIIKLAKKKLKPKIIYLTVTAGNKPAYKLYKKLGFKKIATIPNWIKVRRKYRNVVYMRLNK